MSSNSTSFIASSTWQGEKKGYYFGTTVSKGTGYYLDNYGKQNGNGQEVPPKKRAKVVGFDEGKNETVTIFPNDNSSTSSNIKKNKALGESLLEEAEKDLMNRQGGGKLIDLTPKGIKLACIGLKKAYEKNQFSRAESSNGSGGDPTIYMDSEINLFEHISNLKSIAVNPKELYPILLSSLSKQKKKHQQEDGEQEEDTNSADSIISTTFPQLLMHENTDIAVSLISLLLELLDPTLLTVASPLDKNNQQDVYNNNKSITLVAKAILDHCFELIIANLGRLDQEQQKSSSKDDADNYGLQHEDDDDEVGKGEEDVLSLIENLLEVEDTITNLAAAEETEDDSENVPNSSKTLTKILLPTFGDNDSTSISSIAAYMVRETPILSWLFAKINTLATAASSSSKKLKQLSEQQQLIVSTINNKRNTLLSRCLELLTLLANKEDIHRIYQDWSKLPPYASLFTTSNENNENNGKNEKKKKATNDDTKYIDGIEILLVHGIAPYKKKQPTTEIELDILENSSTALALGLTYSKLNLKAFIDAEGIELAMRCIKERVHAGGLCLNWLDLSSSSVSSSDTISSTNINKDACEYMVTQAHCLKYLFPLYMGRLIPQRAEIGEKGKTKKKTKKMKKEQHLKRQWNNTIQTQIIRILYNLTRYLNDDSPDDAKQRLLTKFLEDEKIDRLIELLLSYDEKSRFAEYKFYYNNELVKEDDEDEEGNDQKQQLISLAALEAKLRGGADIFHRLGAIAGFCCVSSKRCHERIIKQLHIQQSGITLIKEALKEFISIVREDENDDGDAADDKKKSSQQTHKQQLQFYYDQI